MGKPNMDKLKELRKLGDEAIELIEFMGDTSIRMAECNHRLALFYHRFQTFLYDKKED